MGASSGKNNTMDQLAHARMEVAVATGPTLARDGAPGKWDVWVAVHDSTRDGRWEGRVDVAGYAAGAPRADAVLALLRATFALSHPQLAPILKQRITIIDIDSASLCATCSFLIISPLSIIFPHAITHSHCQASSAEAGMAAELGISEEVAILGISLFVTSLDLVPWRRAR